MYYWQAAEELLRKRVVELALKAVPARSLEKDAADQNALLYRGDCLLVFLVLNYELEIQAVYCDPHFSRVILQCSCDEGLRKEETRKPKHFWLPKLDPFSEEINSLV